MTWHQQLTKVPFLDELDSLNHINLHEPSLTQLPSLPALLPPHRLLQLGKRAEPVPSTAFHAQVAFSCSWISVAPTLVPTIQWLSPLFLYLPHCLAEPSLQSQTHVPSVCTCVLGPAPSVLAHPRLTQRVAWHWTTFYSPQTAKATFEITAFPAFTNTSFSTCNTNIPISITPFSHIHSLIFAWRAYFLPTERLKFLKKLSQGWLFIGVCCLLFLTVISRG